jgi:hypothetical protein
MIQGNVEITLEELREDYAWGCLFGDAECSTACTSEAGGAPGAKPVCDGPVTRDDVSRIVAAVDGANGEADWIGVFEMSDGRVIVAQGWCDYTGWD